MKHLMTRTLIATAVLTTMSNMAFADTSATSTAPVTPSVVAPPTTALVSGIDMKNADTSIRPQDDFYHYMNGIWLKNTEIPADKSSWGSFNELADETLNDLHTIVDNVSAEKSPEPGSVKQKIADLYSSYMDEDTLNKLGLSPLTPEFDRIDAITSKKQIPALMAHFSQIGIDSPMDMGIGQDEKDSTKVTAEFDQSGLGLPDRDYYLKDDEALKKTREAYQVYIAKMLTMSGDKAADANAAAILKFETALAQVQWTKVQNRDPVKTYNKIEIGQLAKLAPHFDWNSYLVGTELNGKVSSVIISQPSYITSMDEIITKTPLPVLKAYLKFHVLNAFASSLSKDYVDAHFAFYGTVLSGIPENKPRWKRAISTLNAAIGEGVGKLYVEQYFPPENKARMLKLVNNLITAYHHSVETLDWMSPDGKAEAQKKLSALTIKIGYPDQWRDYSSLDIKKGDLVGDLERASVFEYQRNINKLGKPVDRTEWDMTPQTVNAYYNSSMNEIVFPAAILQPPFFNVNADDAVNYGGIGAVIGHEISHGFDDQGSQFDEVGNLRDWLSKADHAKFAAKTKALITQYNAYIPVKGYNVNGELTLGENIADNSGLAIAYKAYQLSLDGHPAPVIDGFTGVQRLYLGWAQVWRGKVRDAQQIVYLKSDPHSPDEFRGNGALVNQPGFYDAFGVKPGDKMYLPPEQRVIMW